MGPFILAILVSIFIIPSSLFAQTESGSSDVKVGDVQPEKTEATEEAPSTSGARVEKLEVTGSHIRRTDVEGPSPVLVIDRQQIEESGMNSVSGLLQRSTVSSFGSDPNSEAGTVSLRGLGSARTLILINGQRAPSSGSSYSSGAVSADFVPLAAVERIEVLKDGASATYGSDALGGVINIITRKDLDGFSFMNRYNMTPNIGNDNNRMSLAYGYQTAKSNLISSFQFNYIQANRASAFDYAKDLNRSIPFSTNYLDDSGDFNAGRINGQCLSLNENGECEEQISPKQITYEDYKFDFVTDYSYKIGSDTTLYATIIAGYRKKGDEFPNLLNVPGQGLGMSMTGAETPTSWNALPNYSGGDTHVFHRFEDYAVKENEQRYNGALILGLKGYVGDTDWQWDVTTNNQVATTESVFENLATVSGTRAAMTNDTYNPFDITKQDTSSLGIEAFHRNTSVVNWVEAKVDGVLASTSLMDLNSAFGVSGAHFQYRDHRDQQVLNNNVMFMSGVAGQGERQLYSAFSEFSALFSNKFEVQFSARGDFYSDFGETVNPKLALRYQPAKWIAFRSSAGTGFQAPTLQNMNAKIEAYDFLVDQVRCKDPSLGNGVSGASDCRTQSLSVFQDTNSNLKEERSLSVNLGTVIQPTKYFSVSLDYWMVKVEDTIGAELDDVLRLEQIDATAPSRYGVNIIRQGGTPTGRIQRVEYTLFNVGTEQVDGVDLDLQYRVPTSAGEFRFQNEFTYLGHYFREFYQELGREQVLGQFGKPRWRNNLTLGHHLGQVRTQIVVRSFADVEKRVRGLGKLVSPSQFDMSISYDPDWAGTFEVGGINLFNIRPEFDDTYSAKVNGSLFRRFETYYLTYRQDF